MRWVSYLHLSRKHSVHCDIPGTYKKTAALCHWESTGFKGTPVTTVAMSGIVMTDIISWVGLSHWFVDVIAVTYDLKFLQPLSGLRAHFTRNMAASASRFHEVSLQEILYVKPQAWLLAYSTFEWLNCLDVTEIALRIAFLWGYFLGLL